MQSGRTSVRYFGSEKVADCLCSVIFCCMSKHLHPKIKSNLNHTSPAILDCFLFGLISQ